MALILFFGYCFGDVMCIWDSYVCQKVFFVFLFIKVMSGRLNGIVLFVSMLRFQYSLKFSFSSTLAGVYLYWLIIIIVVTFTGALNNWEYAVWAVRIISEQGIWYCVVRWPWPDIKCHRLDYWRKVTGTEGRTFGLGLTFQSETSRTGTRKCYCSTAQNCGLDNYHYGY